MEVAMVRAVLESR